MAAVVSRHLMRSGRPTSRKGRTQPHSRHSLPIGHRVSRKDRTHRRRAPNCRGTSGSLFVAQLTFRNVARRAPAAAWLSAPAPPDERERERGDRGEATAHHRCGLPASAVWRIVSGSAGAAGETGGALPPPRADCGGGTASRGGDRGGCAGRRALAGDSSRSSPAVVPSGERRASVASWWAGGGCGLEGISRTAPPAPIRPRDETGHPAHPGGTRVTPTTARRRGKRWIQV